MLTVVVGWQLYNRTHSALNLGLVGLATIAPMLLIAIPAGQLADRYNRRFIIIAAEIVTGICNLALMLISLTHGPIALIYLLLAISGSARAFLWPANSAYLPQIVPLSLLNRAITWNSGCFQLSAAAGPALGGLIIAWTGDATAAYAFCTGAAFACCILLSNIRADDVSHLRNADAELNELEIAGAATVDATGSRMLAAEVEVDKEYSKSGSTKTGPAKKPAKLRDLFAGFWFVWHQPLILGTISLDLFAVLLGGAVALLPVFARDILHVDASGLGWLQSALPIGSATMALFLANRPPLKHAGKAMLIAVAGFGIATIIFGLSRSYWLSWSMLFFCGAADNVSVIVRQTLIPLFTPPSMLGRVAAVNGLFIGASNEIGGFESGLLASLTTPVFAVVFGGIGTIIVVLLTTILCTPLRRFGSLEGRGC